MIILQFYWIIFILKSPSLAWDPLDQDQLEENNNDQLMSFSGDVATPHPKIQNEWQLFDELEEPRGPRNVQSHPTSKVSKENKESKEDLDLKKAADAWYRNLLKNRDNSKRSKPSKQKDISLDDKTSDRSQISDIAKPFISGWNAAVIQKPKVTDWSNEAAIEKPKVTDWSNEATIEKPKLTEWSNDDIIQKSDYTPLKANEFESEIPDVDMKLKHLNAILNEHDNRDKNRADISKNLFPKKDSLDNLSNLGYTPMADGVYERTLYTLGNRMYEDSKIPGQSKYPKLSLASTLAKKKFNKLHRRSMDKVKLKTSMNKGLPSSALEETKPKSIDFEDFSVESEFSNTKNNDAKKKFNGGQIMDLPNTYDQELNNDYPLNHADTDSSTYLDEGKGQPGLDSSSGDAQDKSSVVSSSLDALKDPEIDFGLYSGLSDIKPASSVDEASLTGIQGEYQFDTSNAEDNSLKSKDTGQAYKRVSLPASYPYAVAKLMADDLHWRNRQKRENPELKEGDHTRRKRSLDNHPDYGFEDPFANEDKHSNVYDPTRNEVPLLKPRPKPVYQSLRPPVHHRHHHHSKVNHQQHHQARVNQNHQHHQAGHNQQQFLAEVTQRPVENFKASFNLSNFFDDIHKMRNNQRPVQQEPMQQTVQPLRVPVQEAVAQQANKKTSSKVKSAKGVRRFFGNFFNKKTTMNPNCVPITKAVNSTTGAPGQGTNAGAGTGVNQTTGPASDQGSSPAPAPGQGSGGSPSSPTITLDNICDSPDAMKLNLSINANVCGNPKTKQFYSNGSISLQPPYPGAIQADNNEVNLQKVDLQQKEYRRQVPDNEPKLQLRKGFVKRPPRGPDYIKHLISQNKLAIKETQERSPNYDLLMTGQLSREIASVVFEFVSQDPELMKLVPVLKRHEMDFKMHDMSMYPAWHEKEKVNQKNGETCYPLPPDLQEFYDDVIKTAESIKFYMQSIEEILESKGKTKLSERFIKLQESADLMMKTRQGSH